MSAEVYHKTDLKPGLVEEIDTIVHKREWFVLGLMSSLEMIFKGKGLVRQEEIIHEEILLEMDRIQLRGEVWALENGDERPKKIPVRWNDDSATGVDYA